MVMKKVANLASGSSSFLVNKEILINQKSQIEAKLSSTATELYHNEFVYRVLAFTVGSTLLVDLKQNEKVDPKAGLLETMVSKNACKFACKIKAEKIVDLVTQTIKMKSKSKRSLIDKYAEEDLYNNF